MGVKLRASLRTLQHSFEAIAVDYTFLSYIGGLEHLPGSVRKVSDQSTSLTSVVDGCRT